MNLSEGLVAGTPSGSCLRACRMLCLVSNPPTSLRWRSAQTGPFPAREVTFYDALLCKAILTWRPHEESPGLLLNSLAAYGVTMLVLTS